MTEQHNPNPNAYQGWHNYQTWCVSLWLSNSEGDYHNTNTLARELWESNVGETDRAERTEQTIEQLAEALKSQFDEAMPLSDASVWSDLLGHALALVDWQEIASHWIESLESELEHTETPAGSVRCSVDWHATAWLVEFEDGSDLLIQTDTDQAAFYESATGSAFDAEIDGPEDIEFCSEEYWQQAQNETE